MSNDSESNRAVIERFYGAFEARDGQAMAALYHPQARFSDPVFRDLRGPRAGHMWRMLLERATDLELILGPVDTNDEGGSTSWEATYTFSATGRRVENRVGSVLRLEGGLILEHEDRFALWAWTRMALGLPGVLLGWTPLLQGKVRRQALAGLERWEAKNA